MNEAPTDISLANSTVSEQTDGAAIGSLAVSDPDISDTHTWSVDDPRFEIINAQLKLKDNQSLDSNTDPTVQINISVFDQSGLILTEAAIIQVGTTETKPTIFGPFPGTTTTENTTKPTPDTTLILTDTQSTLTETTSDQEETDDTSEPATALPPPLTGVAQTTIISQTSTQNTSQVLQPLTITKNRVSKSIFALTEVFTGSETYQQIDKSLLRDRDIVQKQFDGLTIETLSRIQAIDSALISQHGLLWSQLDTQRDHLESQIHGDLIIVGTAGAAASGFTVGFIAWAMRAGFLASGLLAQLPAWRAMDPTLIMQGFEGLAETNRSDQDNETLEELMDRQSESFNIH